MALKDWQWTLVVVAVVAIGLGFMFLNPLKTQPVAPASGDVTVTECQSSTTTAVTFAVVDKYAPASAQTGTGVMYRKIGQTAWTTVLAGASANFAPGDKLEILAGNDTVGYGSYTASWEVPCKTSATFEAKTADFNTANVTGTYWNAAGTANTAQAMAAGDVKNMKFQFTGNYLKDLGNSEIGYTILNCIANTTAFDDLAISGLEETSKPSMLTSISGYDDYTWKFPVITSNTETPVYVMSIDADDSFAPVSDFINCTIYDTDYDIDADTGAVISGVQDEDKHDLGTAEPAIMGYVILTTS